jgi:hypothetical protein
MPVPETHVRGRAERAVTPDRVRPEQVRVQQEQPGGTVERWDVVGHRAFCAVELEETLGELRPEPKTLSATLSVRVALVAPAPASGR